MSWLSDIFGWVIGLLRKAFMWIVNGIVSIINEITIFIKRARHWLSKNISQWLADNKTFWFVMVGILAIVVGGALLVQFLGSLGVWKFIEGLLASVAGWIGAFLEFINFDEWLTFHQIAEYISENYRKIWSEFYRAISLLSDELGFGAGALGALTFGVQHIIVNTMNMLGFTPDEGYVAAVASINSFYKMLDERFDRYARNPQLIFTDLDELILKPYQKATYDQQQKILERIDETQTKMKTVLDYIADTTETIDNIIEHQDAQIQNAFNARWVPFRDGLNAWLQENVYSLVEKMQGVEDILLAAKERQDKKIARLEAEGVYRYSLQFQMSGLSMEERKNFLLSQIAGGDSFLATEATGQEVSDFLSMPVINDFLAELAEYDREAQKFSNQTFSFPSIIEKPQTYRVGWFVGEY